MSMIGPVHSDYHKGSKDKGKGGPYSRSSI